MELILTAVMFLAIFGVGMLAAIWWMGRSEPPAVAAPPSPPPVVIAPPVAAPKPDLVRIRLLDGSGHLIGECQMERRFRRPELFHDGAVFHADGEYAPNVLNYRWTRKH